MVVQTEGYLKANADEYYSLQFSLRCKGPFIEKLRKQMREKRDITRFLLGTQDPFKGVEERNVFTHGVKVYEEVMRVPRADVIRVGILKESRQSLPETALPLSASNKIKGFTSRLLNRQQGDGEWICAEIDVDALNGFLLGLSEYLCDDFGLKDSVSPLGEQIQYPTDGRLRLSWSPSKTSLDLHVGDEVYRKKLTPAMILEVREIADYLLRRADDVVQLKPPLPRYLLDSRDGSRKKTWAAVFMFTLAIVGIYLGIYKRSETESAITSAMKTLQTGIVNVIHQKQSENDTSADGHDN